MKTIKFTNLKEAEKFYVEESMKGNFVTLKTVIPGVEWQITVIA